LKSIVSEVTHILEDTRYFLFRINQLGTILEGSILVLFDVIGLYPHIPHEGGMRAMKSFLDARERKSPSSENLADIILKHNYF